MNPIITWLRRIITIQSIGLMVAIGSLLVTIHQVWLASDGEPIITWHGEPLHANQSATTLLYTTTMEHIPIAPLLAEVENPTQFTAHDVSTRYQIKAKEVQCTPSESYRTQMELQGVELRNTNASLPAFESMTAPLQYAKMSGSTGTLDLTLRLTYNGIDVPIQVHQHIEFCYLNTRSLRNAALADARKRSISASTSVLLYEPTQGFSPLYLTPTANNVSEEPHNESKPQVTPPTPQPKQQTVVTPRPTPQATPAPVVEKVVAKEQEGQDNLSFWEGLLWIVGVVLIGVPCFILATIILVLFLWPFEAFYEQLWKQITAGFAINLAALRRAYNLGFEEGSIDMLHELGLKRVPSWVRSLMYPLTLVGFAVGTIFGIALIGFAIWIIGSLLSLLWK